MEMIFLNLIKEMHNIIVGEENDKKQYNRNDRQN